MHPYGRLPLSRGIPNMHIFISSAVFCPKHSPLRSVQVFLLRDSFLGVITWGATVFLKSFLLGLIIDSLYLAASKYTVNSQANLTWDSLQLDYHCCGVYNYTDWFHYLKDSIVPDSCCVNYTIGCGVFNSTHNIVKTGCAEALSKWLDGCLLLTTILFFVFMLLQGISFTLSSKDQGFDSELSPVSTT